MAAANAQKSGEKGGGEPEPFRLLQSLSNNKPNLGPGFLDFPETPLPPPPPSVEVFPSEVSTSVKYTVEKIILGSVTLLKGRVSTQEVFALSNSDLVPGKYEGGLKLWEGSLDLVKALDSDLQRGELSFEGKRVLELGCGHGLPGVFACLKGAAGVHFQDFNSEVLRCLTIPNVTANLSDGSLAAVDGEKNNGAAVEARFFAGDWAEVDHILPYASDDDAKPRYDIILMAETVYSTSALQSLYKLIKKCVCRLGGIVYMAAKRHYFGVGGGSRQFLSIVQKDGIMTSSLVSEVSDGSSNVREVWKLSCCRSEAHG